MLELENVKPPPAHVRSVAPDLLLPLVLVPDVFDVAHLARKVAEEPEALHDFRSLVSAFSLVGNVRLPIDCAEVGQVRLKEIKNRDSVWCKEPADRAQSCT